MAYISVSLSSFSCGSATLRLFYTAASKDVSDVSVALSHAVRTWSYIVVIIRRFQRSHDIIIAALNR